MRIYLVGYMGVGKSTIGKKLAKNLNFKFIDLDKYIEERKKLSIEEIFDIYGESRFRIFEREALHSTLVMEDVVVATGGGTPCFYDNMQQMNKAGITLYLELTPGILAARIANSDNLRPLVKGKSGKELVRFVEEQLEDRDQYYSQAQVKLFEPKMTSGRLVKKIIAMFNEDEAANQ